MSRIVGGRAVAVVLTLLWCAAAWASAPSSQPASQPADELITLNLPDNASLKLVIDYVSQRMSLNILYDEQAAAQKVTIKSPTKIPRSSLPVLLDSILRTKGYVLVEADIPGWKRIAPAANMSAIARPTTRPVQEDEPPAVVAQIFQLQHTETQRVEPVIKPFLTQPGGTSQAIADQRILIITDLSTNMSRVVELIRVLDQPRTSAVVELVPVAHLEAASLSQQVNQILASKQKAQGAPAQTGDCLDLTADARTNQIILVGTAERISESLKLIKMLDVPLATETRMYQFQSGSPQRVDRIARELIGPLAAKTRYQSAIDAESRVLIVTAPADVHETLKALKLQFDTPMKQEQSPIRFYKLANATASDVLETIRAIEGAEGVGAMTVDGARRPRSVQTPSAGGDTRLAPASPPFPQPLAGRDALPRASSPLGNDQRSPESGAPPRTVKTDRATVTADTNTNSIIVVAGPEEQQIYEQLIKTLDRRRPQVLVECILVTLDTSDNFSLGVEISASNVESSTTDPKVITFSSFGLSTVNPKTGRLALRPGLGFNGTVLSSDVADVVVRALSTDARSRVVSAPRILVNDNATGMLASIAEAPFTSVNASDTVATTSFAGYATAGTTVTLTPHISSDGAHMQLDYSVALNNFSGQGANGIPPPRQTNSVQSKVTIPDGHTIVVGGLNRHDFAQTANSVPGLGQIPILKYLFGSHNTTQSSSTLFVFIRPVVLRDDEFEDLKYLSERDVQAAGLESDYPVSVPVPIR